MKDNLALVRLIENAKDLEYFRFVDKDDAVFLYIFVPQSSVTISAGIKEGSVFYYSQKVSEESLVGQIAARDMVARQCKSISFKIDKNELDRLRSSI